MSTYIKSTCKVKLLVKYYCEIKYIYDVPFMKTVRICVIYV